MFNKLEEALKQISITGYKAKKKRQISLSSKHYMKPLSKRKINVPVKTLFLFPELSPLLSHS